jgi:hypothetical protein
MPSATLRVETEYKYPDDITYPCKLVDVIAKEYPFFRKDANGVRTNEQDTFRKWEWLFEVTAGDYLGETLRGDTEPELTTRDDNKLRQWAEALLSREMEVGEDFDTDTIIGLPCVVTIKHEPPREKKDGSGFFYPCVVDDVMPKDAHSGTYAPPF